MELAHAFLQRFCRNNPSNQRLLHNHIDLFLQTGNNVSIHLCMQLISDSNGTYIRTHTVKSSLGLQLTLLSSCLKRYIFMCCPDMRQMYILQIVSCYCYCCAKHDWWIKQYLLYCALQLCISLIIGGGCYIITERVSVRQLLRVVFSRYAYIPTYVSVTLKNVN